MAANLTKWYPAVSDEPTPSETALHTRLLYNGINDHDQAITTLKAQLTAAETAVTTVIENAASSSTNPGVTAFNTLAGNVTYFPDLGKVNDQLGNPAYTVQVTDNGAKIIVGDSSAVAITLSPTALPWFAIIDNDSSAAANLSPSSGALFGAQTIPGGGFGIVFFDGSNWWCGATPYVPIGIDSSITTAKLTGGGTQGVMVFENGILVSATQAT